MRIRELVELSGQSKTTIHFYQREGLLLPLHKTARNAAMYGDEHLRRLALIQQLRQAGLRTAYLMRAIELVEQGVPVETALTLQRALISRQGGAPLSLEELAVEAQLPFVVAERYLQAGLLGRPERRGFQREDVAALKSVAAMVHHGVGIVFLRQAVNLVNELTRFLDSTGRCNTLHFA
jgi:DNA-binding transcriptional MerR regulator